MKKLWRGIKFCLKWLAIMVGVYAAATYISGMDTGTRTFLALMALAMSIAYIDGTHKDRISDLEFRISELERQRYGEYDPDF